MITCPESAGTDFSTCLGVSAVYRASLALAIMHFIILFCCTMRNRMSKEVNEGSWFCKFLSVGLIFFGLLYVDNSFFVTYSNMAKTVSGFFLIFQIIMIIDLCYIWGERWVAIYDEGNNCWAIVMVVMSLVLYYLTGWIFYKSISIWFTSNTNGCGSNTTLIWVSIIVVIVLSIVTVSGLP